MVGQLKGAGTLIPGTLANIFILRKTQLSSVYHNYSGPLPIIALLQVSTLWINLEQPQYIDKKGGASADSAFNPSKQKRIIS